MKSNPEQFRPIGEAEAFDATARRAKFRAMTETPLVSRDGVGWYETSGCDLSLLETGRAPLLLNHSRDVRDVVGVIEAAWIEGAAVVVIARFGHGEAAELAWQNVSAGIWRNCSLGNYVTDADRRENGSTIIRQWQPHELSLTFQGRCPDAACDPSWDLNSLYRDVVEHKEEARRKAAIADARDKHTTEERRLDYLLGIADSIAQDLGLPRATVQQAMRHYAEATSPFGRIGAQSGARH